MISRGIIGGPTESVKTRDGQVQGLPGRPGGLVSAAMPAKFALLETRRKGTVPRP